MMGIRIECLTQGKGCKCEVKCKEEDFADEGCSSVGELSGEMLDEYMDFCERALVSPDGDEDKSKL